MNPLVFWQNVPSIHQAPLLKELSKIGYDIVCITEDVIPEERKHQGWDLPDYGNSNLIISPDHKEWCKLINTYNIKDSVHIFSGILSYRLPTYAFKNLSNNVLKGIFTEPWKNIGLGKYARFVKYYFKRVKYGGNIDFCLATGKTAETQLQSIGIDKDKVYPFAYFVEPHFRNNEKPDLERNDKLQLLFVGKLIEHKGLDILLKALAKQTKNTWNLTVIGNGPEKITYQRLTVELNLENQITFSGLVPNEKVFEKLTDSDYLILPSRYDGWGAVVNEALSVGTPCIVSNNCGSADLIRADLQGKIFKNNSINDLSSILKKIIKNNERTTIEKRNYLLEWADNNIKPSAGARYLSEIINFLDSDKITEKPQPPWRKQLN